MKKIIDGKVYNTETAEKIGYFNNKRQETDFEFMEETLYRSRKGTYFIAYYGGANSIYGNWLNNTGHSGSGITVLTENETKKWCERVLDVDDYIKIFGEVEEG